MEYKINLEYFRLSTERSYSDILHEEGAFWGSLRCGQNFLLDLFLVPTQFFLNRVVDIASLSCRGIQLFLAKKEKPSKDMDLKWDSITVCLDQLIDRVGQIQEDLFSYNNHFKKIDSRLEKMEVDWELNSLIQDILSYKLGNQEYAEREAHDPFIERIENLLQKLPEEQKRKASDTICRRIAPIAAQKIKTAHQIFCRKIVRHLLLEVHSEGKQKTNQNIQQLKLRKSDLTFPKFGWESEEEKLNRLAKDQVVDDFLDRYDPQSIDSQLFRIQETLLGMNRYIAFNVFIEDLKEAGSSGESEEYYFNRLSQILDQFPNKMEITERICREIASYARNNLICQKVIGKLLVEIEYPQGIQDFEEVKKKMSEGYSLEGILKHLEADFCRQFLESKFANH